MAPKKMGPKGVVNNGSATAKILLLCTNLARHLAKCPYNGWHLLKMVKETYLSSLVNIGSVTGEIFLIWTNVNRTNIAWTNVTVTVGIYSRCFQKPTFKVKLKSGQ